MSGYHKNEVYALLNDKGIPYEAVELDTYLKLPQGSVSPLGILNDESRSVIFAADAALASLPAIGVHPNDNTATVFLSFADLRRIIEAHGNSVVLIDFSVCPPQT